MKRPWLLRFLLLIGLGLAVLGLRQLSQDGIGLGRLFGAYNRRFLLVMAVVAASGIISAGGLVLSWTPLLGRAQALLDAVLSRLAGLRWLNWVGLFLLGLGVPVAVMVPPVGMVFGGLWPRLWLFWTLALAGVLLVKAARGKTPLFEALVASILAQGLMVEIAANLPSLSGSMFSLAWSEGSRYYEASRFAAPLVYGASLPLPVLHPTRYLLQSLAFLIPGASIGFDRAWQVVLWLLCNGLASWTLARRLKLPNRLWLALAAAWSFLFFFSGPVYYHLVLCAVPVLLWFDRRRFWRSLVVVIAASIWAGLSRINWYPVPGLLAVILFLLEEPQGQRKFWRYLVSPAAWSVAGLAAAYLANAIYIRLSGNPPDVFGSALSSPLLWYRLFPNNTYGPGILWASVYAFLPVFFLLAYLFFQGLGRWNLIRLLGVAGILGVFFAGGLVVSVKIGGGGNLHNLDNFIVFLVVVTTYAFFGRFVPDRQKAAGRSTQALLAVLLLVVVVLPVESQIGTLAPIPPTKVSSTREAAIVAELQKVIDSQAGKGPVLFLTERQLLTFHDLKVSDFEPDYEKVFLMEMAMAGNPAYLERFHEELHQHRFSMIVTERMNSVIQDRSRQFSEENNAWVEQVELPVKQSYQREVQFDDLNVDVYLPQ